MKKRCSLVGVLVAVMVIPLILVTPVTAADKAEFQCMEIYVDTLDPGSWSFPDGNIHVRGLVELFQETGPDPRLVGNNTVVVNANWHSDMTGPIWGTFRFETDEGGLWEGNWAGQVTAEGAWYNARGDGYGIYEGMKGWWHIEYDVCQATLLEH